ncbi:MAG: TorF family putative porin [Cognatishimia sp.]
MKTVLIGALAMTAPLAVNAQELNYFGSVDITSNYTVAGVTQTNDNPALQAYLEAEMNGFYFGVFATNVEFGTNDNLEVDLSVGYRHDFEGGQYLDVGYARYFFDGVTGNCCGEIYGVFGTPFSDAIWGELYVAYDPNAKTWDRSVTLGGVISDTVEVSATLGESDVFGTEYWDAGATFNLTDRVSADLRYVGASTGDVGLVAGLSIALF